jgi:hypothetical protein
MSFVFEHPELRPDGGIVGLAWQVSHDLRCRRTPAAIEDIHDLPLAAGEGGMR